VAVAAQQTIHIRVRATVVHRAAWCAGFASRRVMARFPGCMSVSAVACDSRRGIRTAAFLASRPRMVVSTSIALRASPVGFSAKEVMRPASSIFIRPKAEARLGSQGRAATVMSDPAHTRISQHHLLRGIYAEVVHQCEHRAAPWLQLPGNTCGRLSSAGIIAAGRTVARCHQCSWLHCCTLHVPLITQCFPCNLECVRVHEHSAFNAIWSTARRMQRDGRPQSALQPGQYQEAHVQVAAAGASVTATRGSHLSHGAP
jgi:hypothetical protein